MTEVLVSALVGIAAFCVGWALASSRIKGTNEQQATADEAGRGTSLADVLEHHPTGTLFSGDVIIAGLAPFRFFERLDLAKPGFSLAVEEAHERTRAYLRGLTDEEKIKTLCAGHGPIVTKDTQQKLRKLAH